MKFGKEERTKIEEAEVKSILWSTLRYRFEKAEEEKIKNWSFASQFSFQFPS